MLLTQIKKDRMIANKEGQTLTLEMQTMESYQLTAFTAVKAAELVLAGKAEPGYRTPAGAFGSEFIDQFDKYKLIEVNG